MNNLNYILAGNATFTIRNTKTGNRYTFKVSRPRKDTPHFVKLLTGPDNDNDYVFIGTIFNEQDYRHSKKSSINVNAQSVQCFTWTWQRLLAGNLPDCVEVYHNGTCGRCGRTLTVPESIESGFGPECVRKI